MGTVKLTFACGDYDLVRPLLNGDVQANGVDIDFVVVDSPREIFDSMSGEGAFDLSEFSCSEFISMAAREGSPLLALPVFPSRAFRQGAIFVNRNAGIERPEDIEGKRVGVPRYSQTAAVWIRGILQDDHGVDPERITWIQGSVDSPGPHGSAAPLPLPETVEIENNDRDRSLSELLAGGEIDALIGSRTPPAFGEDPDVVRLFPDHEAEERGYARRRGIYPVMHLVALRRKVYDTCPWVVQPLYEAFCAAKDMAFRDLDLPGVERNMLRWLSRNLGEVSAALGPDPWPYGIEKNRKVVETLVGYMVSQHLIAGPLNVEELFLPVKE